MRENRFEPSRQCLVIHRDKRWDTEDVTPNRNAQQVRPDQSGTLGRPVDRHIRQCRRNLTGEYVEQGICRRLA
jgi:hypothetical protein